MNKSIIKALAACSMAVMFAACSNDVKNSTAEFKKTLGNIGDDYYSSIEKVKKTVGMPSAKKLKKIEAIEKSTSKKVINLCTKTSKSNRDNQLGVDAIVAMDPYATADQMQEAFDRLSAQAQTTNHGKVLARKIENKYDYEKATPYVDFEIDQDLDNPGTNVVRFSDYVSKDKYTLACFWYLPSSLTKDFLEQVRKVEQFFGDRVDIVVISSMELDNSKGLKDAEELGITWPVINNGRALAKKAGCIKDVPTMMLITPDGKVLKKNIKSDDLVSTIRKYLVF